MAGHRRQSVGIVKFRLENSTTSGSHQDWSDFHNIVQKRSSYTIWRKKSKHNIKILTKSQILSNILRIMERQSFHDVIMVPDPTHRIMEEINGFVKQNDAEFIVGLTNSDIALEAFLKEKNIAHLDLSNQYRFPRHGHHWTNRGHDFVTDKIERFLINGGYLNN